MYQITYKPRIPNRLLHIWIFYYFHFLSLCLLTSCRNGFNTLDEIIYHFNTWGGGQASISSYMKYPMYILNSVISTLIISLTLQYPKTLGNGCSYFKSYSLLSHFSPLHRNFCHYCKPPKKSTHTLALRHVSICGVSSASSCSYASCWMLVHAYATSPRIAKWSGPHEWRWEGDEFVFHSVTCYTNPTVPRIHVNNTKICNITCTLVTTVVTLRRVRV